VIIGITNLQRPVLSKLLGLTLRRLLNILLLAEVVPVVLVRTALAQITTVLLVVAVAFK
jgi:hypothetical protein